MKTKSPILSLLAFLASTFVGFIISSCTKVEDFTDAPPSTEQLKPNIQTAIIGSWQIVEKGVEVEMQDQHVCSGMGDNKTSAKTTVVQWNNVTIDETQSFKQNGVYSQVSESAICQGSYKTSINGELEVKNNCKSYTEKIVELTAYFLTVKKENRYFKYRRLD
jgi:hypothetical protein